MLDSTSKTRTAGQDAQPLSSTNHQHDTRAASGPQRVSVLQNRYVRSWPRHIGGRAYELTIGAALTRAYTTDAHVVAYVSPIGRRLSRDAIARGVYPTMTSLFVDVDCADVHGSSEPAPETWRESLLDKIAALAVDHPNPYVYFTRGGARIVYGLEAWTLTTAEDAREWSRSYAVLLAYLSRLYDIDGDPACHDWTRLFRAPRATREGGSSPEARPTWGDLQRIGTLTINATAADIERAMRASKAWKSEARILDVQPCASNGVGLLYRLLAARGDILSAHPHVEHAWIVRCPREHHHSTGRTGDGSTVLYPPTSGIGGLACLHAHCASMTLREWLGEFSEWEIETARRDERRAA